MTLEFPDDDDEEDEEEDERVISRSEWAEKSENAQWFTQPLHLTENGTRKSEVIIATVCGEWRGK